MAEAVTLENYAIPAQAGIQTAARPRGIRVSCALSRTNWIPACAGMTIALLVLIASSPAHAQNFHAWLSELRTEAASSGVSQKTISDALDDIELDHDVLKYDRKQPESTLDLSGYQKRILTDEMIEEGRNLFAEHRQLLDTIGRRYGVEPQYIVALWGIETKYGTNTGNFQIVPSLVTLAYEGRRGEFFRGELIAALKMIDTGNVTTDSLFGSWAGATGQCQFMPSTYVRYAADGDYDGRKDIWDSLPDVFASIANYIKAEGWVPGIGWGRQVSLQHPIPAKQMGRDVMLGLAQWNAQGVRNTDGTPLLELEQRGALVKPEDNRGRTFLVTDNFNALMRWNRSTYFAITTGMLAEAIAEP